MHYTQKFQRSIHQPATGVGALGALLFAACPPIGLPILILGFMMQREFTKARRAHLAKDQQRAVERARQTRILALKSLR